MARKPQKKAHKSQPAQAQKPVQAEAEAASEGTCRTHLKVGWLSILVFLCIGIGLESLHGFKSAWYLDTGNETRRLMFTLAHAHGVLLGLVNIAYAFTQAHIAPGGKIRSRLLIASTVLLPSGFGLGGLFIHDGDPGIGILLVPPGALALLICVALTTRAVFKR